MFKVLIAIIELVLIISASWGISFLFLKKKSDTDPHGSTIIRITLGLATISYLTLLAAALHLIGLAFFIFIVVAGNLLGLKHLRPEWACPHNRRLSLLGIILSFFIMVSFFYSLFPPTFYDSMLYHLAIPQYYLAHGGIMPWNCNFNSNLPLTGEMLFMFSMLGGTVHIPKLLSFFAGISILILMYSWSKNHFPTRYPMLGPILFFTIPQVGFLMASSKPDMLGMLFLLSAFYCFFLFMRNPVIKRNIFLCGIFWGLAISTKYIFGFYFFAFLFSVLLLSTEPIKKRVMTIILISLLVLACLLPWMIKNTLVSGNPIYPYFNTVFKSNHWSSEQSENFSAALKRGHETRITAYLFFPFELFIKPYKYGVTAVWGILFLLSIPFLFFTPRQRPLRFLLCSSLIAFVILMMFARVPRYFLSSLLLMAIPVGTGMGIATGKKFINRNILISLLIFVLAIHQVLQFKLQESFFQGLRYVKLKILERKGDNSLEYLNIVPYYRAAKFINRTLTRDDLIILLGEERTFYLKKSFIACSFADHHPIIRLIKENTGFADFKRELHVRGITHILYSEAGLQRLARSSKIYRLSDPEIKTLKQHLGHFDIIYRDFRYSLYRLKNNLIVR